MYHGRELHTTRIYRLLARVPWQVSFPTHVYRVDLYRNPSCPQWELQAESLSGGPHWRFCHSGADLRDLEHEIYAHGFEILHPTAASTILDEAQQLGYVEIMPAFGPRRPTHPNSCHPPAKERPTRKKT